MSVSNIFMGIYVPRRGYYPILYQFVGVLYRAALINSWSSWLESSGAGISRNSGEVTINTISWHSISRGSFKRIYSYIRRRIRFLPIALLRTFLLTTTETRERVRWVFFVHLIVIACERTALPLAYTYLRLLWPWNRKEEGIMRFIIADKITDVEFIFLIP